MSYPSITSVLEERRVDLNTATQAQLEGALLEAFRRDLPDGMSYLKMMAAKVKQTGQRLLQPEDPNSPLGKQLIRLLGTDVARGIVGREFDSEFGIEFGIGLYNCCGVVMAPTREALAMNMREQIMLQNGVLASADC